MMSMVRIGIIGCGEIAHGIHIPGLLASQDAVITAICDIDRDALRATQKRLGLHDDCLFTDFRDLLVSGLVDAVTISTPNNMHYPIAMQAVKAGIPYAVEKPMTLDAKEALSLADATRESQLKHMVCFTYRFKAAARYARKLILGGHLGRIYHVHAQYMQSWATKDQPLYWRFSKAISGSGTLGDLGCHIVDLVRFMTGQEYTSVTAAAGTICTKRKSLDSDRIVDVDVDDWVHFLSSMTSGISAVFASTRFAIGRGNYQRIEVFGEFGSLIYHFENEKNELEICIGDVYRQANVFATVPVSAYESSQMQTFIDRINGTDDGLAANAEDGFLCQQVCDAVLRSADEEKTIKL